MKVYKDINKKYYKYTYDNIQTPIFSSQTEAETGINGVKFLTCSDAYQITSTNSGSAIAHNQLVTFDMGEDCMYLESVGFIGVVVADSYPSAVMSNVECSEDNENWTTISDWFGGRGDYLTNPLTIPQPNNYRYLRFTSRFDDERYSYSAGGMYNFTIKYNKRNIIDGTSSDYDFYKDVNVYKGKTKIVRQYFDQIQFNYSPIIQTLEIPSSISKIHVVCAGSSGFGTNAGLGGTIECDLNVSNIETLYMVVGCIPTDYYNPQYGASDIRTDNTGILDTTSLQSRLIVAGAGGSTYWTGNGPSAGGSGGGIAGSSGGNTSGANGGGGGTQSEGGNAGSGSSGNGNAGAFGLGGASGYNGSSPVTGAGGAGWYGGGSGGWYYQEIGWWQKNWYYAGGGGGSSYPEQDNQLCENVVHTQGNNSGNGYIIISTLNGEHFYKDITEYKAFKI